jgi:hypothetical protein
MTGMLATPGYENCLPHQNFSEEAWMLIAPILLAGQERPGTATASSHKVQLSSVPWAVDRRLIVRRSANPDHWLPATTETCAFPTSRRQISTKNAHTEGRSRRDRQRQPKTRNPETHANWALRRILAQSRLRELGTASSVRYGAVRD